MLKMNESNYGARDQADPSDQLRNEITAFVPDPRSLMTVVRRSDGSTSMVTLAERHENIASFELTAAVPADIRVHFETSKNLYLYAWFVYRFHSVAEQQALATLEFALRECLGLRFPSFCGPSVKRSPGLSLLLGKARKEKLISNDGLRARERLALLRARDRASMARIQEMTEKGLTEMYYKESEIEPLPEDYAHDPLDVFEKTLPLLRNTYAHGDSMLHPTVLGTFEIVTDLVNQLYPEAAQ